MPITHNRSQVVDDQSFLRYYFHRIEKKKRIVCCIEAKSMRTWLMQSKLNQKKKERKNIENESFEISTHFEDKNKSNTLFRYFVLYDMECNRLVELEQCSVVSFS